jgi:signal transduction histidine kinase
MKEGNDYFSNLDNLKRFSGKVAHDFNNVLTGVLGFTQLILMDMKEENEFFEDMKQIESAAKKGKTFTDQLLLFSQKRNSVKKGADINKIIEDSLEEVRGSMKKDVRVTTDLKKIPTVNADSEKIGQAVKSIVINSNEAIEDKGEISLSTGLAEEGKYILVDIRDNGRGASPEDLSFIFEPFYKTEEGRKTEVDLVIAYEIIKEHGGEIEAQARDDGGMIFKIRLPV